MTSTTAPHDKASHCHNCGAAVDYNYCSVCGQETTLHVASAGEFIHEFVGHYVALEGRLWKTLAYLLFRPGFLTAEYIAGRRVRYVQPLRVYLTFSILFFAVLKFAGPPVANYDLVTPPVPPAAKQQRKEAERAAAKAEREADRAQSEAEKQAAKRADQQAVKDVMAEAQREFKNAAGKPALQIEGTSELSKISGLSPSLDDKITRFLGLSTADRNKVLSNAFYAYVPYAMFCLMPLFAFYLKLLYLGSGRRYGEHLLFALHANAFAFAMIGTAILVSFLDWGWLTAAVVLWLVIYLPKAMRRVYGGGRFMTFLRWIVLMFAHLISIAAAIISAFGMAVLG